MKSSKGINAGKFSCFQKPLCEINGFNESMHIVQHCAADHFIHRDNYWGVLVLTKASLFNLWVKRTYTYCTASVVLTIFSTIFTVSHTILSLWDERMQVVKTNLINGNIACIVYGPCCAFWHRYHQEGVSSMHFWGYCMELFILVQWLNVYKYLNGIICGIAITFAISHNHTYRPKQSTNGYYAKVVHWQGQIHD